jgi:hypothetical protein
MKITILDDWFDTLRPLPCFDTHDGHGPNERNDAVQYFSRGGSGEVGS